MEIRLVTDLQRPRRTLDQPYPAPVRALPTPGRAPSPPSRVILIDSAAEYTSGSATPTWTARRALDCTSTFNIAPTVRSIRPVWLILATNLLLGTTVPRSAKVEDKAARRELHPVVVRDVTAAVVLVGPARRQ